MTVLRAVGRWIRAAWQFFLGPEMTEEEETFWRSAP